MRFLCDMGIGSRVVEWLRQQGYDALHLREQGLQRLDDDGIFEKAGAEARIVLATDLGFGELAALSKGQPVSVVLLRLRDHRTTHVIDRLGKVLPAVMAALESGAIVVVEETRHRVRRLPLGS